MTEEQTATLLDAADVVGGVAQRMEYFLNDLCGVLGGTPISDKIDKWAQLLFKAAHVIRRTAKPELFP